MPFLIPFAAPLIMGGASVAGGYLASRKSKEEKEALSAQTRLAQLEELASSRGFERSKEITPFTNRFLSGGAQGLESSMGYWNKLLSGRESASSLLSPEINQIVNNYGAARTASRTLNPRGGGSSALTREIDEAVVPGQIGGLLATARPQAAQQIATLGSNMSSQGSSLASVETGLLRGVAPGSSSSLLDYGLRNRGQQFDIGSSVGGSLFEIFKMFNKGGTPQIPSLGTNPAGSTGYNFLSPGPTGSTAYAPPTYRREGNTWGLQ